MEKANQLEQIFLIEGKFLDNEGNEISLKPIGEPKRVEYARYDFLEEAENNIFRDVAIRNWAPKEAKFFRIIEFYLVNQNINAFKIEYFK